MVGCIYNKYIQRHIDGSLHFCQKAKGMEIYAWCIMINHVNLVFKSIKSEKPEQLLSDFKRFTSKAIVKAIIESPSEYRKDIFLKQFELSASKSSNVKNYQFWRHENRPI